MRSVALVVLTLLALAGCSDQPATNPSAPAATTPTTTGAPTPQQAFVADVLDYPGLTTDMDDDTLIGLGDGACNVMAYQQYTREQLVTELGASRLGPQVMGVIVDAAHRNICPQYNFPVAAAAPVMPTGTYSTGTYEVGVDIQPGRYRSPGGNGCYWARLDESQDIIDNNLSDGPTVFDVAESDEFVELNRCTWTLSE